MSYSVYFKYGGKKYKLPVNPEEIKRSRQLNIENYQVLGTGQVSGPSYWRNSVLKRSSPVRNTTT